MHQRSSEFGLIEQIKSKFSALLPSNIEGIGDDCAVIKDGYIDPESGERYSMLLTSDLLVEDVHFLRHITPRALGVRAVEVNLSDVAAMGGRNIAIMLSVALPSWVDDAWCAEFFEGIYSCGVPLIGGDTTRSKSALCINITAIGVAKAEHIKYRSSAEVGDYILVGGELGGSAASGYSNEVRAQREEGIWLGEREEVGAMMDLSDGLAGDLRHILELSRVSAIIDLNLIPVSQGANIEQALSGGEDYKLLFTVNQNNLVKFVTSYTERFGYSPYVVGRVVSGVEESEIFWQRGDDVVDGSEFRGFIHF